MAPRNKHKCYKKIKLSSPSDSKVSATVAKSKKYALVKKEVKHNQLPPHQVLKSDSAAIEAKSLKNINPSEDESKSYESSDEQVPKSNPPASADTPLYKKYEPGMWKNFNVGTILPLSNIDVECQVKLFLKLFFLKKYPLLTFSSAVHLAAQLRDPEDSSKLLLNTELFTGMRVKKFSVGSYSSDVTEEDTLQKKYLKVYNLMTNESHMRSSHIWGPALAALFVSGMQQSLPRILKKLQALGTTLSESFPDDNVSFPVIDDLKDWTECIQLLSQRHSGQLRTLRNTVLLGYILRYHREETAPSSQKLLHFLSLEILCYSGMSLISLTLSICQFFKCTPSDVQRLTSWYNTKTSWKRFERAEEKYMQPQCEKIDPLWRYARIFDGGLFKLLSYNENFKLCQALALIIDFTNGAHFKSDNPKSKKICSIYDQMQANRKEIPPAPEEFRALCHRAYEKLKAEFLSVDGQKENKENESGN